MNQTAILPDFMTHSGAGPQCQIRMSDSGFIMGGLKPRLAENVMAVGQKSSFIHGHFSRLGRDFQAILDPNQVRLFKFEQCARPVSGVTSSALAGPI
jgi:hypothetical protein